MRLRAMIGLIESYSSNATSRSGNKWTQTIPIPLDWKPAKPSESGKKLANKDNASTRATTRKIPVIKVADIATAWTADLKAIRK